MLVPVLIVFVDCFVCQTNIEMMKEEDFTKILELEEQYIQKICNEIIKMKPDVIFTEKGISDLAQHYLVKVLIPSCGGGVYWMVVYAFLCAFVTVSSRVWGYGIGGRRCIRCIFVSM